MSASGTPLAARSTAPDRPPAEPPGRVPRGPGLLRLAKDNAVVVCFVALFVALSVASRPFLTTANLLNILSQQSFVLIIAVAGTVVLICGGLDISIAAVFALSAVVGALTANHHGTALGVAAGVAVGGVIGLLNGLMTTVGRVNPLIATLATSFAVTGLAVIISGGKVIVVEPESWGVLGNSGIGVVRYSIIVTAVFVALVGLVLNRTVYGRQVFATGGNEEAAWLSGIRTNRVRCVAYVLSGLSAGIGGVIVSSQVGVGQAQTGQSLLFTVIAGIVVGGTSILGGEGSVARTCVGVLLIALVNNGFNLLSIDPLYEQIVEGVIILLAVGADGWTRRAT